MQYIGMQVDAGEYGIGLIVAETDQTVTVAIANGGYLELTVLKADLLPAIC